MSGSPELLQHQVSRGGVLPPGGASPYVGGSFCPPVTHFGNAATEYNAAQSGCVLFDLSDRVQIELSGSDARSFLNNFCTNDVKRLEAGQGCEALLTSVKGRILAHLFVFVTEGSVWLDSPPTDESKLLAHFDRYLFSEDVQLSGRTETFGEVYVAGEASGETLSQLGIPAAPLELWQHALGTVDQLSLAVRRVDVWDAPGFMISSDRSQLVLLWQLLVKAGAKPGGAQAFHARRIEAGFPIHGVDVSEENLAQEAMRSQQAISFTKGCYLGQEPIARLDALGHVNRQVTRLRFEDDTLPPAGAVVAAEDRNDVGSITSAVVDPDKQQVVALAMLRSSHARPGTSLRVANEQRELSATVL